MFQLNDAFLQSIGLGDMPDEQRQDFLEHLYEVLELRVGDRLSEGMTDQELEEFEELVETNNQPGSLAWLQSHRPDFKDVVAEELEKLKQEVIASKEQILAN